MTTTRTAVQIADENLAKAQRENASKDVIAELRDARDAAIRDAVGASRLAKLDRNIVAAVDAGDEGVES